MLNLSYEYKLNPTDEQILEIERTLIICRKVWNYALRERKDWINSRKSPINACSIKSEYIVPCDATYPNYFVQAAGLTNAKKLQNSDLKTVNAQMLQQVLRKLETAFVDMKRKQMGFPRFKNRYRMRSFVFPQMLKNCIQRNTIKLPQLGVVEFIKSREIPDGFLVKQARIIRKASGYFVIFCLECDVNVPEPDLRGFPIGIDLGLDQFLATSENKLVSRPKFLKTEYRKLKLLQRRLSNKTKGSNNRHKLNRKIARLHQRVTDHRKDWHFKLAHDVVKDAGMIFVEDIDFRVWAKGMFGKHTLDAGFGQFISILSWVCWKQGVYFEKVNKDYTSQVCPNCDTHTGKKELDNRVHNCSECGYTTHRDVAAAQVIRNRGLSEEGRFLDIKEIACGGGLTGTGNSLVKSLRDKKKKV